MHVVCFMINSIIIVLSTKLLSFILIIFIDGSLHLHVPVYLFYKKNTMIIFDTAKTRLVLLIVILFQIDYIAIRRVLHALHFPKHGRTLLHQCGYLEIRLP